MREGYGSCSVSVSVTALAATYLVYTSKVRWYRVSCRLLNVCIVWILLKTFCSGDMASFACHDDQRLGSFSTKHTPIVLDTITNGIVYEPLAKSLIALFAESWYDISTWFAPPCMPANAARAWCNLILCTFLWSLQSCRQALFLEGIWRTGVHNPCHPIPHLSTCEFKSYSADMISKLRIDAVWVQCIFLWLLYTLVYASADSGFVTMHPASS